MIFSFLPAALTLALTVPPPPLWTGPSQTDPLTGDEDPGAQPDTNDPRTEAAAAFAAGEQAYADGDYALAIERFEHAQSLLPHPATAFNLGLAQRRSGQPLRAWDTFTTLRDTSTDPDLERDAKVQLAELSAEVARLRVSVPSGQVVHVDDDPLPADRELVRLPGPVRIQAGATTLDVQLEGGELRHVDLRWISTPAPSPQRTRGQSAVLGATVILAAATVATGTSAALLRDRDISRPLGLSAVALGGTTLAAGIAALALHVQQQRLSNGSSRDQKRPRK